MALIPDMLSFWRRPVFTAQRERLGLAAIIELLRLLAFSLGGVFAIFIAIGVIFQVLNVEPPRTSAEMEEFSMNPVFPLLAIVIVPTLEEILFRSWLGIKWGVMLIMPLLLWGAAAVTYMQDKSIPEGVDFMIIVGLSTLIFVHIIQYCRAASNEAQTDKALHSVFPMIFWMTAILFGAIHITNFEGSGLGLFTLIVTLPQVFIGAVLGFLRMRFGPLTAIGFHGAYNGTLLFISFLALQTMKGQEGLLIESLRLLM